MLNDLIRGQSDVLILLARLLLMALFLATGWKKLTNFSATAAYMASTGAPLPSLSTAVAIAVEFFAGIALVLGVLTRPLALLYVVFTFATALLGHRFWTLSGAEREANKINFLKNLSIMGGLLLLAITGPGKYALWP
ncbi:putative oxidoreductase [Polaromonas sp. OV174]|uniref:DoxX family protein n=1 Tax=Polaromonas sp. OV174 TaxID=1855300 RepID=UPI0008E9AB14|nr:DoxX family protein [Polaromonas sp. OV174]SFC05525.1 putative oxidoreductase [Polaromonas sp. OV174]